MQCRYTNMRSQHFTSYITFLSKLLQNISQQMKKGDQERKSNIGQKAKTISRVKRNPRIRPSIHQILIEHLLDAIHCSRVTMVSRQKGQLVQIGEQDTTASTLRAIISMFLALLSNLIKLLMDVPHQPKKGKDPQSRKKRHLTKKKGKGMKE